MHMHRSRIIGLLIICLFLLVIAAGCGGSTGTPPPAAAPQTSKEWVNIGSWSGSGIKSTETFKTTANEWRINWKSYDEPFAGAGIIQIFVNDEKGNMVTLAANVQGEGNDVSYVRTKPGSYYLEINSANVKWEVTVEEQR